MRCQLPSPHAAKQRTKEWNDRRTPPSTPHTLQAGGVGGANVVGRLQSGVPHEPHGGSSGGALGVQDAKKEERTMRPDEARLGTVEGDYIARKPSTVARPPPGIPSFFLFVVLSLAGLCSLRQQQGVARVCKML